MPSPRTPPELLQVQIDQLQQKLQELLSEPQVMDDEVNAVERDLEALKLLLAKAG
jgi:hypothetical protein